MNAPGDGGVGSVPLRQGMLTLEDLEAAVAASIVDTVVVAFTDMQGRLLGKRLSARYFLDAEIAHGGVEGCDYLLAVDMEMEPQQGYAMSSWDRGYGDFRMLPDMSTLRKVEWLEGTAMVLCDLVWHDGTPVAASPRQVLRHQLGRARELGYEVMIGSELEFYLFEESYAQARSQHFRSLTPSVPYVLDYHVLATTYAEGTLRDLRNYMERSGISVECSKGEASPGQHELNLRYSHALEMADNHTVYKNGAKEIAHGKGHSITFMAKPSNDVLGSSCHVHTSWWRDGHNAFASDANLFSMFIAGQAACAEELALFFAPNVSSYKRYLAGSWAPTSLAWGRDNRTCGFRSVGEDDGLRLESRIPGADANPYLAFAAIIASGLFGVENDLDPGPPCTTNAYESSAKRFPSTLREAIANLEGSTMARDAFGDEVVDHYLNYAHIEQRLFDQAVTCYERERFFERT